MNFDTIAGDLAQKSAESLDAWIARQAATLGMTVAELAERFDLEIGDPDIRHDPDAQVLSIERTVRLLSKEQP